MSAAARRVAVVPHTHWDREWYLPFPRFRTRLVELLDELLDTLEADPAFGYFLLDGQLAVVDDYLAVRPQARERLTALNGAGRLGLGPWYVLPDEFLVSGETLVRNLQLGRRAAEAVGGAQALGYLPDMFGHVAQLPQILQQAGIGHAVVWRGVPRAITTSAFDWVAPDGSTVRAEYLPQGYGNGAFTSDDPVDLVARVDAFVDAHRAVVGDDDDLLWMIGGDHTGVPAFAARVVDAANAAQDRYVFAITPLDAFVRTRSVAAPGRRVGELRSGARANLLMGVMSNRVDVKQAAARAERLLERVCEPLFARFLSASCWPATELATAWHEMIVNSAHDSICACSADAVVDAVLARYAFAEQTAYALIERAQRQLAPLVATPSVYNTVNHARTQAIERDLGPAERFDPAIHQLVEHTPATRRLRVPAASAAVVVERELEIDPSLTGCALAPGRVQLTRGAASGRVVPHRIAAAVAEACRALDPHAPVEITVEQTARDRVVALVAAPALGHAAIEPRQPPTPVTADATAMSNGLLTIAVLDDGSWTIDGIGPLGRLVDGGDAGDTYNYSPPRQDQLVDRPAAVSVAVVERGPIRARLHIRRDYDLPDHVAHDRRAGLRRGTIDTTLELVAGEPFVRVVERVANVWRDHRLRAHFALPRPAATSQAECAFTVVTRGRVAEGGPTEAALTTFPSRRFVSAGGLTVVHEGLLEHELVDDDTLAITLLRCTGFLSRGPMTNRPLPAGPELALEGPQLQGVHELRYAVTTQPLDPFRMADDAFVGLIVVEPIAADPHRAGRSREATPLSISGGVLSACTRDETGARVVRVYNPSADATPLTIEGTGAVVDLFGNVLGEFDGQRTLRPHEIVTLRLDG